MPAKPSPAFIKFIESEVDALNVSEEKKNLIRYVSKKPRINNHGSYSLHMDFYLDDECVGEHRGACLTSIKNSWTACIKRPTHTLQLPKFKKQNRIGHIQYVALGQKHGILPTIQSAQQAVDDGLLLDLRKETPTNYYLATSYYRYLKESPSFSEHLVEFISAGFAFWPSFFFLHRIKIGNDNHAMIGTSWCEYSFKENPIDINKIRKVMRLFKNGLLRIGKTMEELKENGPYQFNWRGTASLLTNETPNFLKSFCWILSDGMNRVIYEESSSKAKQLLMEIS